MLHNEARELLIKTFETYHDAKKVADIFSVSKSTVYRLREQKEKTGSVALHVNQRGRKPLLTDMDLKNIQQEIESQPDITIEELRQNLNLQASYSTVERAVLKLGYTLKKKSLYATERRRPRRSKKTRSLE